MCIYIFFRYVWKGGIDITLELYWNTPLYLYYVSFMETPSYFFYVTPVVFFFFLGQTVQLGPITILPSGKTDTSSTHSKMPSKSNTTWISWDQMETFGEHIFLNRKCCHGMCSVQATWLEALWMPSSVSSLKYHLPRMFFAISSCKYFCLFRFLSYSTFISNRCFTITWLLLLLHLSFTSKSLFTAFTSSLQRAHFVFGRQLN